MPDRVRRSVVLLPRLAVVAPGVGLLACALAAAATGTGSAERQQSRILSASWDTDNAQRFRVPPAALR